MAKKYYYVTYLVRRHGEENVKDALTWFHPVEWAISMRYRGSYYSIIYSCEITKKQFDKFKRDIPFFDDIQ